jgi:hypothetical protein
MTKYILTRKRRAAAASCGILVVTIFSLMFYHYGQGVFALIFEVVTAVVYAVWVSLGPVHRDEDDDPDDHDQED